MTAWGLVVAAMLILPLIPYTVNAEDDFGLQDIEKVHIVEENDKTKTRREMWETIWRESFSGSIGHISSLGSASDYRGLSYARLYFDHTLPTKSRVVLGGTF